MHRKIQKLEWFTKAEIIHLDLNRIYTKQTMIEIESDIYEYMISTVSVSVKMWLAQSDLHFCCCLDLNYVIFLGTSVQETSVYRWHSAWKIAANIRYTKREKKRNYLLTLNFQGNRVKEEGKIRKNLRAICWFWKKLYLRCLRVKMKSRWFLPSNQPIIMR